MQAAVAAPLHAPSCFAPHASPSSALHHRPIRTAAAHTARQRSPSPSSSASSSCSATVANSLPSSPPRLAARLSNAHLFTLQDEALMRVAFEEGRLALSRGEVPVGVVYARNGQVVARAGNETNQACDATRHAELVALEGLASCEIGDLELYVTVEPCIMCAGALANVKIKKVTFGCANDKFGGCGSVLAVHDAATFPDNADHLGFEARGGLGHEEAVELLREFYARENGKTPRPRPDGTARRVAKRRKKSSPPLPPPPDKDAPSSSSS